MLVIFDLFGVVVRWSSREVVPKWAELVNRTSAEFRAMSKEAFELAETGKMSMDEFWAQLGETFEADPAQLRKILADAFEERAALNEEVVKVVLSCPERVLLSNQLPFHADECSQNGWLSYFDEVFLSFEIGYRKPAREAFEHVLSELGKSPEECVLVDDKEENVEAAKELGMRGVVFEDVGQLKKELERLV